MQLSFKFFILGLTSRFYIYYRFIIKCSLIEDCWCSSLSCSFFWVEFTRFCKELSYCKPQIYQMLKIYYAFHSSPSPIKNVKTIPFGPQPHHIQNIYFYNILNVCAETFFGVITAEFWGKKCTLFLTPPPKKIFENHSPT